MSQSLHMTLTPREQEVLVGLAEGYSAKEIAQHSGLAPRTVERHIENMRLKLRARNTPNLIKESFLNGILTGVDA